MIRNMASSDQAAIEKIRRMAECGYTVTLEYGGSSIFPGMELVTKVGDKLVNLVWEVSVVTDDNKFVSSYSKALIDAIDTVDLKLRNGDEESISAPFMNNDQAE